MQNALSYLLHPRYGITRTLFELRRACDEPVTALVVANYPGPPSFEDTKRPPGLMNCCGTGDTTEEAVIPAAAEMLERYCAASFSESELIWATYKELQEHALDLNALPTCSEAELLHPKCPLVLPDVTLPIRWVHGIDFVSGEEALLPAVMVYTHLRTVPAERFWLQTTSGCAAHTSYERAAYSAILELMERDMLTTIWLQQMELPRIEVDEVPQELKFAWEGYERSSRYLEYQFFDATNDFGIPIVYGIRTSSLNDRVATLVSCAAADRIEVALLKAMRDLTMTRRGFTRPRSHPRDLYDFVSPHHGASYLADSKHASAFNFLINSKKTRKLSYIMDAQPKPQATTSSLKRLLEMFSKKRWSVYLADLTTEEARSVNMRVVRAIIPQLQPVSFCYAARFLANPRLMSLPRKLGLHCHTEAGLNPLPQPFY